MQVSYARVGLVKEDIPVLSCRRYLCQRYMGVASLHGETEVLHVNLHGVHWGGATCSQQMQLLALHGGPPWGTPHVHPPLY